MNRTLIETLARKTLKDMKDSPERSMRNFIDLGILFTGGRFKDEFLESVQAYSELYEKHPDWVLRHEDFEPTYGRGKTQMLLDLTNPQVQDFVFGVVDTLMKENPGIEYIKWDHNMCMYNASSLYLNKNRQSNLYVDHQLALQEILKRYTYTYYDPT